VRALAAGGVLALLAGAGGEEVTAHDAKARCRLIDDAQKRKQCLKKARRHNRTHRTTTTTTTTEGTTTTTTTAEGTTGTPTTTPPPSPGTGTLRLCKVAGTGVEPGTAFDFTAGEGGDAITVEADACVDREFPQGELVVREIIPAGTRVVFIAVDPYFRALSQPDLTAGTVTVAIVAGERVRVRYLNRAP
jgi:hypothetical protein